MSESTAVATVGNAELGTVGGERYFVTVREAAGLPIEKYPDEKIRAMLKMAVPQGVNFSTAAVFLGICHRYRLDPTMGQIWLAETDDGPKVLTGRDTFIKVAEDRDTYRGYILGIVHKGEEARLRRNPSDPWEVAIDHTQGFGVDEIVGGYLVVYDANRPPLILRRSWGDYSYLHGRRNWKKDPKGMFENRLIAAGLRRMYSLSGLLMLGEEEDLGAGADVMQGSAEGHARSQAETLKSRLEAAEQRNGVAVEEEWNPDLTVPSGKYIGKTWREVAGTDPKWVYTAARRGWHGLGKTGRTVVEWLDNLNAPEPAPEAPESTQEDAGASGGSSGEDKAPEGQEEPSRDALTDLRRRGAEVCKVLIERKSLTWEESEELDLLFHEKNVDGLRDAIVALEEKAQQGRLL